MSDEPREVSPEEFILDVLRRHYARGEDIEKTAMDWNVSPALVRRIIAQYGSGYTAYSKMEQTMKKESQKKLGSHIRELDDGIRKATGIITKEDMDDLLIDLGLFGKGGKYGDFGSRKESDKN